MTDLERTRAVLAEASAVAETWQAGLERYLHEMTLEHAVTALQRDNAPGSVDRAAVQAGMYLQA